ncbi:hypothetical protein [Streptomyces sp. NBC_01233]|nr:hypothetical protein OG332_28400 [Streptomyces sp. NBC_01233]
MPREPSLAPRPAGRAQDPGRRPVSGWREQVLYVVIALAIGGAIILGIR